MNEQVQRIWLDALSNLKTETPLVASGLWVAVHDRCENIVGTITSNNVIENLPSKKRKWYAHLASAELDIGFKNSHSWSGLWCIRGVLVFTRNRSAIEFLGLRKPVGCVTDDATNTGAIGFGPRIYDEEEGLGCGSQMNRLVEKWLESGYWRANRRPMSFEQFAFAW